MVKLIKFRKVFIYFFRRSTNKVKNDRHNDRRWNGRGSSKTQVIALSSGDLEPSKTLEHEEIQHIAELQ